MNRAEAEGDSQLFSVWLGEWNAATRGEGSVQPERYAAEAGRYAARLQRLRKGIPPLRRAVTR